MKKRKRHVRFESDKDRVRLAILLKRRYRPNLNFRGAIPYAAGRPVCKGVLQILEKCLSQSNASLGLVAGVGTFLDSHGLSWTALQKLCDISWHAKPEIADQILDLVRAAGYEGTKYDLWRSLCGCDPPHKCLAGMKSGLPSPTPGFVSSGQTKKPGSHGSDRHR